MTSLILDGIKQEREAIDWRRDHGLRLVAEACLAPIAHEPRLFSTSVHMARVIVHYDEPRDRTHAETIMRELCFGWMKKHAKDKTFDLSAIVAGTAEDAKKYADAARLQRALRRRVMSPGKRLR